jgi:hypothetical protein
MATKSLREVMVVRKNLNLCHVFIVYNKMSTFIVQTI